MGEWINVQQMFYIHHSNTLIMDKNTKNQENMNIWELDKDGHEYTCVEIPTFLSLWWWCAQASHL